MNCKALFASLLLVACFNTWSQQRTLDVFPEKYQLEVPDEWKKPKLLKAITSILPRVVSELKEKEFCMECKGGYTVRLVVEPLEPVSQVIIDQKDIRDKMNYLFSLNYKFRAVLSVYDSLENPKVEVLLVDPETVYSFKKEFTLPSSIYENAVYDQGGKLVKQNFTREEKTTPSAFVSDHQKDFTPTVYELMAIAEQKVFQLEATLRKLRD